MTQYLSLPRIEGPIWLEPNEIITIQTLISEAQEQLVTLENRMNEDGADSELASLKSLHAVEIASLQNIVSPIRRMPPEIVSEIFRAYCAMDSGNAAHATPKLWSEIRVQREGYRAPNAADSDIATQWLSRSGDLPLDLNISLRMGYRGNISQAFLAFSHRIRSLEVCLPMEHFEPFIHLPKSSFPSLETLIVDFRNRDPFYFSEELQSQHPSGIEIFSDSRQLKYVEFTEAGDSCLLENIKFPPDAVTSLKIAAYGCCLDQFLSLYFDTVRGMNQLVHCKIEFPRRQFEISDTSKPIILPFLQSLSLSEPNVDTGYAVAFFRCLYAPLLKDLHLGHESQSHTELVKQLAEFRARSAVSLSSLHLSYFLGDIISGEDLIPLVAAFPSICILRISNTGSSLDLRPVIHALVYDPTSPGPLHLPNLEELYLDANEVEEEEVRHLIQSYWRPINENNAGANEFLSDVEGGGSRVRKATILTYTTLANINYFAELAHESALHGIQFEFQL
ncbi:hypothetical protein BDP27DRAFT_1449576 [Rhodocollybia butyracea]|uniref:F-box domain-containing protein n=1 Tax=Rhodocollybia butyracea TaxID=206335 RepID=A0A9P5U5H3_9AGAR|nr:hypothetical protein BDP27DRAFT_1449576 [Rhodocollybia butyracea]